MALLEEGKVVIDIISIHIYHAKMEKSHASFSYDMCTLHTISVSTIKC